MRTGRDLAPEPRIDVLSVLEAELESLRPDARVYQQRTAAPVFFRTAKAGILQRTRAELAELKQTPKTVTGAQRREAG
ncbi:hypothetical protein EV174_006464, partial [Coemansia sp. RSA 2320]